MKDTYQVEYIKTRDSLVTLKSREESCFNTRSKVLGLVGVGGLVALVAYKSKKI